MEAEVMNVMYKYAGTAGVICVLFSLLLAGCVPQELPPAEPVPVPQTPGGLVVLEPTSMSLTVTWNESEGATNYQVFRDLSESGSFDEIVYSGSEASYFDAVLDGGTTYFYKVSAGNASGYSSLPAGVSGTTYTAYIVGSHYGFPCYWDGSRATTYLDMHHILYDVSGCMDNGTFYAAGRSSGACYWKGTEQIDLFPPPPYEANNAYSLAIAVSNGTVYTAGYYDRLAPGTYGNNRYRGCFWTGTTVTTLLNTDAPDTDTVATSVFVYNGEVYTAGYCGQPGTSHPDPCFWRGEVFSRLDSTLGKPLSIIVSDDVVYVAGGVVGGSGWKACYWANGVKTVLSPEYDGRATGICVYEGTVYTCGYYHSEGKDQACYWKGTEKTDLPDAVHDSRAYGITVHRGTVYVSGSYSSLYRTLSYACYWAGGIRVDLTDGTSYSQPYTLDIPATGSANAIYIE